MLKVHSTGSFQKTVSFLNNLNTGKLFHSLNQHGRVGVDALSRATPSETGETAQSWGYQVGKTKDRISLSWYNTHENDGVNIAVIIQYGHGTGTGAYIQGKDYINPAMRPIFDRILEDVWRQVTNG